MIDACFQPGGGALALVLREIAACRHQLRVFAYGFTSDQIAAEIVKAMNRGVDVALVVDARASGGVKLLPGVRVWLDGEPLEMAAKQRSVLQALVADKVPVWLDAAHQIMHQKVLVLDASTVMFGSMNFTESGILHNAENFVRVHDAVLAKKFLDNWELHMGHSTRMPSDNLP